MSSEYRLSAATRSNLAERLREKPRGAKTQETVICGRRRATKARGDETPKVSSVFFSSQAL